MYNIIVETKIQNTTRLSLVPVDMLYENSTSNDTIDLAGGYLVASNNVRGKVYFKLSNAVSFPILESKVSSEPHAVLLPPDINKLSVEQQKASKDAYINPKDFVADGVKTRIRVLYSEPTANDLQPFDKDTIRFGMGEYYVFGIARFPDINAHVEVALTENFAGY